METPIGTSLDYVLTSLYLGFNNLTVILIISVVAIFSVVYACGGIIRFSPVVLTSRVRHVWCYAS